jgi:hypothetical protein
VSGITVAGWPEEIGVEDLCRKISIV